MNNEKVFLRAFNLEDHDKIFEWLSNQEILELTSGNKYFASKDYVKKWLEGKIFDKKNLYLGICLSENASLIGYLSINDIDHLNRKATWGGLLIGEKKYWGKGLGTVAARLMLDFVFNELNINLFWAFWLEEHMASIKMGEKVGFKKIGLLPQSVFKKGEYRNQVIMYLLREDYKNYAEQKSTPDGKSEFAENSFPLQA